MPKILKYIFFVYVAAALAFPVLAQENWDLKKEENGIKVYTRRLSDEKLKEIKVVTELPGTPAQLAAVILDVDQHKKWVYGVAETKLLKKISNQQIIYYNLTALPWPVSNRDLVMHVTITKEPNEPFTTIRSKTVQHYLPENKGIVRVPFSAAHWKVTPLSKQKMLVEYTFSVDPGGSLPTWLVNAFAVNGPYSSFVELQKILQQKNSN